MNIFAIAVFAALGGAFRVLLEHLVSPVLGVSPVFQLPLATLVNNLIGSFLIGFFYVAARRRGVREWLQVGVSVGFLGAFTTFSAFTLDILQVGLKNPVAALVYVGLSLVGGVFLVLAGESFAESWVRPRMRLSSGKDVAPKTLILKATAAKQTTAKATNSKVVTVRQTYKKRDCIAAKSIKAGSIKKASVKAASIKKASVKAASIKKASTDVTCSLCGLRGIRGMRGMRE